MLRDETQSEVNTIIKGEYPLKNIVSIPSLLEENFLVLSNELSDRLEERLCIWMFLHRTPHNNHRLLRFRKVLSEFPRQRFLQTCKICAKILILKSTIKILSN